MMQSQSQHSTGEEESDPEEQQTMSETETARPSDPAAQTASGTNVTLPPGLKGGFTLPLLVTVISCGFGSSFQLGFQLGCLNIPEEPILQWQNNSFIYLHGYDGYSRELIWSATVSILSFGAGISCCFVGYLADTYGRKRVLMYNNLLVVASTFLMFLAYWANNYMGMILSRIVMGFNMGINTLAPMYLSEISPINLRGTIGCMAEVFTNFGILFSYIVGLPFLLGTNEQWIFIFLIPLFPLLIQLVVMGTFSPESPKYSYVLRNQFVQAHNDLKLLKGTDDVDEELDLLDHEAKIAKTHSKVGCMDIVRDGEMRWSLILALFFMFSVQFSGASSVAAYSKKIFESAKLSKTDAQLASCGISLLNIFMLVASAILLLKFKFCGRRLLYLLSLAGCFVFTAVFPFTEHTGEKFAPILCILLFIAAYAFGMGAISGVYANEVFAAEARATGWGIAMVSAQFLRLIVLVIFTLLDDKFGSSSFFLFTSCMMFSLIFGFIVLPETRNKVFDRIQRDIKRKRRRLAVCC